MPRVAERKRARAVPEAADGELLGSEAAELVALEVAELLLAYERLDMHEPHLPSV